MQALDGSVEREGCLVEVGIGDRREGVHADVEGFRGGEGRRDGALNSPLGGFSLYVQGGKLRYTYSFVGVKVDDLIASERMPTGKVRVRYEFTADDPSQMATGGTHRLFVAGQQVAEGKLEHTVPVRFSGYAGLDIGRDNGLPVSPNKIYYLRAPFPFEGTIEQVVFEVE